ncbi:hypothetical protein DOE76_13895 [Leifsonia sp. ku-ls]|nr:hypothetical protein DOE76_13895 [Leifsonia sp. ku-ls]
MNSPFDVSSIYSEVGRLSDDELIARMYSDERDQLDALLQSVRQRLRDEALINQRAELDYFMKYSDEARERQARRQAGEAGE